MSKVLYCAVCCGNRVHTDGKCEYCIAIGAGGYRIVQAALVHCTGCDRTRLAHIRAASHASCGACGCPIYLSPPL